MNLTSGGLHGIGWFWIREMDEKDIKMSVRRVRPSTASEIADFEIACRTQGVVSKKALASCHDGVGLALHAPSVGHVNTPFLAVAEALHRLISRLIEVMIRHGELDLHFKRSLHR